jgi:hypothetical protein
MTEAEETKKMVPMTLNQGMELHTIEEVQRAAKMFCLSAMFPEKEGEQAMARACVKIIAGQELGLKPFQSMRGIDIINGTPAYRYQLVAAKVKQSGRYDFTPIEVTDTAARIQFFDRGKPVFISEYTIEQARKAGLAGKEVWQKHPSDMLYARAMTKGVNKVCPEIFFGECYTPEEVYDAEGSSEISVGTAQESTTITPTGVGHVATELPKSKRGTKQSTSKPQENGTEKTDTPSSGDLPPEYSGKEAFDTLHRRVEGIASKRNLATALGKQGCEVVGFGDDLFAFKAGTQEQIDAAIKSLLPAPEPGTDEVEVAATFVQAAPPPTSTTVNTPEPATSVPIPAGKRKALWE